MRFSRYFGKLNNVWLRVLILGLVGFATWGMAQRVLPAYPSPNCAPAPEPRTTPEQAKWEEWPGYQEKLTQMAEWLPDEPELELQMPVWGIQKRRIADTFAAPRSGGRRHEGQDIFARRGTPVYSASEGYVLHMDDGPLGGLQIYILGAGGRRYYYAHFERINPDLAEGQWVTPQTLLGFVGNTGDARNTPPHLHFGIYMGSRLGCDYHALDPLPLLKNRDWQALAAADLAQGAPPPRSVASALMGVWNQLQGVVCGVLVDVVNNPAFSQLACTRAP
jgi:murein DD-endopeptidase MepM/ murein hydrolase activator NlpD